MWPSFEGKWPQTNGRVNIRQARKFGTVIKHQRARARRVVELIRQFELFYLRGTTRGTLFGNLLTAAVCPQAPQVIYYLFFTERAAHVGVAPQTSHTCRKGGRLADDPTVWLPQWRLLSLRTGTRLPKEEESVWQISTTGRAGGWRAAEQRRCLHEYGP